ncbi:MAG: type II toxin-antitoxin system RelE/ParE family toxin [Gammaproteobacteria bacterium]
MRVHWTGRAKARLRMIHDYIAEDSPQSALQMIDRITARSQQLIELPRSGRRVTEYKHNDVRELLEKPFRIIYIIKPNQIDVLTVMHYRQILPQDIERL